MPKLITLTYSTMSAATFLPVLTKLYEKCQQENQKSIFIKCPIPHITKPNFIKVAIGDRNTFECVPISQFENLVAKIRNNDHFEMMEGITYNIPLPLLEHILQKENGHAELNTLLTTTINTLANECTQANYDDFIFIYCGEKLGFGVKTCISLSEQTTVFPFYSGEINLLKYRLSLPDPEIYAFQYDLKKSLNLPSIFDEYLCDTHQEYEISAYHFGGLSSFINHANNPCCHADTRNAYKTNASLPAKQILSILYNEGYEFFVRATGGNFICNIQMYLQENDHQLPKNFLELLQQYNILPSVMPISLFNHEMFTGNDSPGLNNNLPLTI